MWSDTWALSDRNNKTNRLAVLRWDIHHFGARQQSPAAALFRLNSKLIKRCSPVLYTERNFSGPLCQGKFFSLSLRLFIISFCFHYSIRVEKGQERHEQSKLSLRLKILQNSKSLTVKQSENLHKMHLTFLQKQKWLSMASYSESFYILYYLHSFLTQHCNNDANEVSGALATYQNTEEHFSAGQRLKQVFFFFVFFFFEIIYGCFSVSHYFSVQPNFNDGSIRMKQGLHKKNKMPVKMHKNL